MPSGTIYGVVLNDRAERDQLATAFTEAPYKAPPQAPVVYVKPASALATSGRTVLTSDVSEVRASSTLALLFSRDAVCVSVDKALSTVGAAALALDLSVPAADYYRPDIPARGREGFVALGAWGDVEEALTLTTSVDGKAVHDWSLERLVRSASELISDLSQFMTLAAGDVLLVGLPGDAPLVGAGHTVVVSADGFDSVELALEEAN